MKIHRHNNVFSHTTLSEYCFGTLFITLIFALLSSSCSEERSLNRKVSTFSERIPDKIDFNFHVRPILSDRCYTCHGPDEAKREAGLRLDTEQGALTALGKELNRFAIVPGSPDSSTLVHRIYAESTDDIMPPPESNLTLSPIEKEILKKWIEQGAEWKQHWAFLPPENKVPVVSDELNFVRNDIDKFVLKKLKENGLSPSPRAKDHYLLRRIAFDLTGLPPTLKEVEKFEGKVDEYITYTLNKDAYAERMAAEWLDLARYSDTHGYQDDLERVMWPWRDWVLHAYKNNMPYDQFVTWQLAGDLMENPTREQLVATGFNRNHKITQEGGVIPEEYRVEYVSDRTQTFGTAFLGLSVECAKCHDHKYDPISQKDYYSLYAFFNSVPEKGLIQPYGATPEPFIEITDEEIEKTLTFINNRDTATLIQLMVMEDMEKPRETYVLNRGEYDNPTERVHPRTPETVMEFGDRFPKNRLGLAQWLFDPANPVTARVAVNRLWQMVFGEGIVSTSYDFGNQGALPSHPELLDHLAIKFKDFGWDQKKLLTYILSSGTYQQSSKLNEDLLRIDPENRLLARSPRKRMTAEMLRDNALAVSGLLNEDLGGPSVKPYQPEGLWAEKTGGGGGSTAKYVQDKGEDVYRRSIYTFWKRTVPPPSMMTFDGASRDFCVVKRQSTTTPLQALVMLNDPQIIEASKVLALNLYHETKEVETQITSAFYKITSRKPSSDELSQLKDLYFENQEDFKTGNKTQELLSVGQFDIADDQATPELASLTSVILTIFNLDESISLS
ncbi:PSD1 and planctomycete cytochrome C domain-containing protein [Portibacter marinus]|uniref:PSD1 and planctomycete cytochrome C domain-containing protein n=1 Tax=Portibacter marinus TaxID=2898660 RepID=UPI001F27BEDD|nr:PSD1 and planctomycete cytochrome C domain-containing protein [Portibacter marinus]